MQLTESELRQVVREELEKLSESRDPADMTIETRRVLQNDVNSRMNKIIKSLERRDRGMADWAKDIQEDLQDVMEELYDLGNELSVEDY
jgi:broad-specificity NMP kinase